MLVFSGQHLYSTTRSDQVKKAEGNQDQHSRLEVLESGQIAVDKGRDGIARLCHLVVVVVANRNSVLLK